MDAMGSSFGWLSSSSLSCQMGSIRKKQKNNQKKKGKKKPQGQWYYLEDENGMRPELARGCMARIYVTILHY